MRQRRLILICLLVLWAGPTLAQTGDAPASFTKNFIDPDLLDTLWLAAIEPNVLLAEDAAHDETKRPGSPAPPARFALPAEVAITPENHGRWIDVEGGKLWMLKIRAPGATDLNFGFGAFNLPRGATLHVFSPTDGYFRGPYGAEHVRDHGELWTPMIPGDTGVVELFVPKAAEFQTRLELVHVGRGYRDLFSQGLGVALKQGDCNIDVVCPEGDPWRDQIRSSALYSLNGFRICSGTLINNAREDRRPLFLTSDHCGITAGNASTVVVFWNYESPVCGQLGGGSLAQTTSGATLLVRDRTNDMSLVELDEAPERQFNAYYAGWDAFGSRGIHSVGIHHPSTDQKAISFNNNGLLTTDNCIGTGLPGDHGTHWEVDWEAGMTEPGSSGSGLFDSISKRLVGYLSGGTSSCEAPNGLECYGKLSVGWQRGLAEWLDPGNTGTRTVPGLESFECHPNAPLMDEVTVTYAPVPQEGKITATGVWVYYGLEGLALESMLIPFGEVIPCTVQFFGNDPIPGMDKKCYFNTNNGVIPQAYEGGLVRIPPGVRTRTYTRTDDCSLTLQCSNDELGRDPAFNFFKQCTYDRAEETVTIQGNDWLTIDWRQYPVLTGDIEGPSVVEPGDTVTWTTNATGGKTPYTYAWTLNGEPVGTDATWTRTLTEPGLYILGLTVTDDLSDFVIDVQWVSIAIR